MKKFKLIILACMLFAQGAAYAIGIDLGLEFGVSNSNFKLVDDKSAIENEVGYGVGISAKVDLPLIDLGPELWYTRNTLMIEDTKYFGEEAKIKCHSIDLPLIVSLGIFGPVKIEGGPSISLFSKAKAEYGDQSYDMGRFKPEMGYVVGAKVTVLGILMVSARYNGCLSKSSVDFMGTSYDMRTSSYTISVGAMF
ncbi:MAG: outer membrane beta-barrel protein [Rikenellaceae bacterium]